MNTKHSEIEQLLPWFVNGTLDAEERALLESHLPDCAACNSHLTFLQDMDLAVGKPNAAAVPSRDVLAQTLETIRRGTTEPTPRAGLFDRIGAFLGAALVPRGRPHGLLLAMAVMGGVILYQNLWQIPGLRAPGAAVTLTLKGDLRAAMQDVTLPADAALVLRLDHPEGAAGYDRFVFELTGEGRTQRTPALAAPTDARPYLLNFQKGWREGKYTLTLFGTQDGTQATLATYSFRIRSQNN